MLACDRAAAPPGHLDPAEKAEDAHPKLWCALGGGRVLVFDASSWAVHQHCFKVGTARLVSAGAPQLCARLLPGCQALTPAPCTAAPAPGLCLWGQHRN